MRTRLSRGMLGALLAMPLLIAATCGYDPNPESGTLQCGSSNTCPEGYSCRSGRCWKDGADSGSAGTMGAGGAGGTTGRGGSGGSGGAAGGTGGTPNVSRFIGTWVFDGANSKRVRQCNDGTNETLMPWNDYFTIAAGTTAPLKITYYCPWNGDASSSGTTTVIRAGQTCAAPDANTPTTIFTWRGESFTLTTTNGLTGTLEASLPYDYVTATGSGSCTMKFTGVVNKN